MKTKKYICKKCDQLCKITFDGSSIENENANEVVVAMDKYDGFLSLCKNPPPKWEIMKGN